MAFTSAGRTDHLRAYSGARQMEDLLSRLEQIEDRLRAPVSPRHSADRELVEVAQYIFRARRRRLQHFDNDLFADPGDMLLDLFVQFVAGRHISTTSLCIASCVPATAALRWIAMLERADLIERVAHPSDQRCSMIGLTELGADRMRACLADWLE